MKLEKIVLENFRCFGHDPVTITFHDELTAFVGDNGSGKTAALLALHRMFGVTQSSRRIVRQDFHVSPQEQAKPPSTRNLAVDYFFSLPELQSEGEGTIAGDAIPQFFHHIATDKDGIAKCRLRLEATWTDNGSSEGIVDERYFALRTMDPVFTDEDRIILRAQDRARIQMIYVPAMRDGASQVASFLRGRLWRAVRWSAALKETVTRAGTELNRAFQAERGVEIVAKAATERWRSLYTGGTYTTPVFAPVDVRFSEFINNASFLFQPDHEGAEQSLSELSDGQRSLFHLAMTAAAIDVESSITESKEGAFELEGLALPALTIIGVEEPENNLAPFYLSRIVGQIKNLAVNPRAQGVISSHSASILARVDPGQVRHFRLKRESSSALVRTILLPKDIEEADKYIREAVRTYPELYFATFVILGEGASEEVVLPRMAEAMNIEVDRSFVAVVPLGGRHVKHLWKLLNELEIPHATLLDLDLGRPGGGWGRIKGACSELVANGCPAADLVAEAMPENDAKKLIDELNKQPADLTAIQEWCRRLEQFGVYFCSPLDLDMSMLAAFGADYRKLTDASQRGPTGTDPWQAVLGDDGDAGLYGTGWVDTFRWYRYLFLGRGKPTTHVRVLAPIENVRLAAHCPPEIRALLNHVGDAVFGQADGRTPQAAQPPPAEA